MSSKTEESKKLRDLLETQMSVLCALNQEVGKNIVKLAKLEKIDVIIA